MDNDSRDDELADVQTIPLTENPSSALYSDSANETGVSKQAPRDMMMVPQRKRPRFPLQKRFLYIIFLLLALWTIERSTGARVFVIFQQHEPSVRIFRSLFEIFLLLVCTAASIQVYIKYLGASHAERLLFYKPFSQRGGEVDYEMDQLSHSEIVFQDHDDDDIVEFIGDVVHDISRDKVVSEEDQYGKDLLRQPDEHRTSLIPSPADLFGAALDLLIWILITLVFYTVAAIGGADESLDTDSYWAIFSSFAAPTFPLILFIFVTFKAFFPIRNRMMLMEIVSFTIQAPWYEVSFRDGMIGDILTSMVRPMQDIAFTVCYLLFGLNQWWSHGFSASSSDQTITSNFIDAADANVPAMEKSWLLHTLILPACAVSPLWYRFLQNMRQIYDQKRRWPYIGNAAKYFVAAQVAMFGVYHPEVKDNPVWLLSFVFATLYQIWWDLVMDWGLFVKGKRGTWMLRSRRLYSSTRVYWAMVVVNTILRFCWTLSFIPLRYLSATGVLTETVSSEGWATVLGPLIASAEIIRRSLWGLLRVEWEIVKDEDDEDEDDNDNVEMTPMKMQTGSLHGGGGPFFGEMSTVSQTQLVVELSIYTATFAVLGILIAAHRGTL